MEENKQRNDGPREAKADDIVAYSRHYNEKDFFAKIKEAAGKAGGKAIYVALTLYYSLENASFTDKMMILGALGYFILPTDLIPDFIIGLGYTDDLAALLIVYNRLKANINERVEAKALNETRRWFPNFNPGKELKE
ncbi:MAG: DUF1232 domain-containing protein [Muribaculaceae bacterium]|nr:DUF1232 domain-containing protein [Muribaculaceae bacterium]